MNISWDYDRHIAVDASVVLHPLPEVVKACLETASVATADTFSYEISAYQTVVSDEQFTRLVENLKLFREAKRINALFSRRDYRFNDLNRDIYGLVCLMSGAARHKFPAQRRSLLLTADLLLTEQVAAENIPIDIYLVGVNQLYTPDDFPRLLRELNPENPGMHKLTPVRVMQGDDLTVYRQDGTVVELSSYYPKRGGEAHIYDACSISPDYVAKIFYPKFLTMGKIRHVQNLIGLNRKLKLPWTLFPLELLYKDPDGANPVGYVMLRAGGEGHIEDVEDIQYTYQLCYESDWHGSLMKKSYSDYLRVTLMLARQCLLLATCGILPSDYHPRNYAEFSQGGGRLRESSEKDKLLYMWDTDSFFYKFYFSERWWSEELVPVWKHRSAAQACAEALYQAVFSALTLGMSPFFEGNKDRPRFDTIPAKHRHQFFFIPENLRGLFHDVLFCGQLPSIPRMVTELTIALEEAERKKLTLEDVYAEADQLVREGAPFWEPRAGMPRVPRRVPIPCGPAVPSPAATMRKKPLFGGRKKNHAHATQV